MKKIVLELLDTKYPDAFIKKTIFGNLCCFRDDYTNTNVLAKEIRKWFDMSMVDAREYVEDWYSTLPVVVSIRNSTNPAVLIDETVVVNPTL
jgi:hypothetical protein